MILWRVAPSEHCSEPGQLPDIAVEWVHAHLLGVTKTLTILNFSAGYYQIKMNIYVLCKIELDTSSGLFKYTKKKFELKNNPVTVEQAKEAHPALPNSNMMQSTFMLPINVLEILKNIRST